MSKKKIHKELAAIRKELQAIRKALESAEKSFYVDKDIMSHFVQKANRDIAARYQE